MIKSIKSIQVALILILFMLALIIQFPATVSQQWLESNHIKVNGINGTIWKGSASEAEINRWYLRDIKWEFIPKKLFSGEVSYQLSMYPFNGLVDTALTLKSNKIINFKKLKGNLSHGTLETIFPYFGIDSAIKLNINEIIMNSGAPTLINGKITLYDLIIKGLSNQSVGSYEIDLITQNNQIIGSFDDINALLDVAGTITITRDGKYVLTGVVASNVFTPENIKTMLTFLGSANEKNQRNFRFEGEL
ncbi:MAG: type II secretion system protein N [Pseudomonadota bacterium]|nr:type II secretion system protein N [Pseudomonadota bacterium]